MRTAQDKWDDLTARGRTPQQIRAVAVAREDKELLDLVESIMGKPQIDGTYRKD